MAILVDEAIWWWRGERWAHLASDADAGELHRFANRLGLPRLAYQGDHYDVTDALRARALELGARAVGGRELVSALRAAGLRRRGGLPRWELVNGDDVGHPVVASVVGAARDQLGVEAAVWRRPSEFGLWIPTGDHMDLGSVPVDELWWSRRGSVPGYEVIIARL